MDEHDLKEGDATSAETASPTARMLGWAKNSAAYRLSRRMMTEQELRSAIIRKAKLKFEDISQADLLALAEAAIDFGRRTGALDDKSYAEARVRAATRAGKSRRLIARQLQDKGVNNETAAEALQDADDQAAAISFARKRGFGPFRRVQADEKRQAKELSAFARSGFSFELAKRVLDMSLEETDLVPGETSLG